MLAEEISAALGMRLAMETDALIKQGLDAVLGEGNWTLEGLPGRLLCISAAETKTYLVDGVRMFAMSEPKFIVRGMNAELKYQVYPYAWSGAEEQTNRTQDDKQARGNL